MMQVYKAMDIITVDVKLSTISITYTIIFCRITEEIRICGFYEWRKGKILFLRLTSLPLVNILTCLFPIIIVKFWI